MIFDGKGLRKDKHFNFEVEYLLDNFIVSGGITLVYAPPKNGKSCLAMSIAKYILDNHKRAVYYLDFDNPIVSLKDKKIDEFICKYENFEYLHPDVICMDGKEALSSMVKDCEANSSSYKDVVLVFDSVTDFCVETDESSAKSFMYRVKFLRNAGATIILLHHTNKRNMDFKGSSVFQSASDNVFALNSEIVNSTCDNAILECKNARFGAVHSVAFCVTKYEWKLEALDYEEFNIPWYKREFINSVKEVLLKNDSLSQNKLLEALGKTKDDRTTLNMLEEFNNRYWIYKDGGKGRAKKYSLK